MALQGTKDSEITPFLHRKGNTLKGERLSVSAKAQALQNTPKAAQQEQQEDTQIQFQNKAPAEANKPKLPQSPIDG